METAEDVHPEEKNIYKRMPEEVKRAMNDRLGGLKRIETNLHVKVWVWDKQVGHKLFNFHDGYVQLPIQAPLVGSCKCNSLSHTHPFLSLPVMSLVCHN